jgi:hypothetical protein
LHGTDGKTTKTKTPIMPPDEERFVAFYSLVQWTQPVVTQSARVSEARDRLLSSLSVGPSSTLKQRLEAAQQRIQASQAWHTACHFFAIAALKLLDCRDWVLTFGLCASVDFGEVDRFSAQDIRDLRNMREHVRDYFAGAGDAQDRWTVVTPEYQADAGSVVGTMIGGRLDWVAFGAGAERLLQRLLAEPIPYPPQKSRPPSPPIDAPRVSALHRVLPFPGTLWGGAGIRPKAAITGDCVLTIARGPLYLC